MDRPSVFIIFSKQDLAFKQKIEQALQTGLPEYLNADIWSDAALVGGDSWETTIVDRLESAKLVLLLLSDAMLGTPFVRERELPIAERHWSNRTAQIYPILLSPLTEEPLGWLEKVHVKPRLDQPLSAMGMEEQSRTLDAILSQLIDLVRQLSLPNDQDGKEIAAESTDSASRHVDFDLTLHHRDLDLYRAELRITYRAMPQEGYVLPYEVQIPRVLVDPQQPKDPGLIAQIKGLEDNLGGDLFPMELSTDCEGRPARRSPRDELKTALDHVQHVGTRLHLRITIAPSAQELHRVCWERLLNPIAGTPFSTDHRFGFSRHVLGYEENWREIHLLRKPGEEELLTALVVVAAGEDETAERAAQATYRMAAQCIHPVRAGDIPRFLDDDPDNLIAHLKTEGVDILYLSLHRSMGDAPVDQTARPKLTIPSRRCSISLGGSGQFVDVNSFARSLADVRQPPRLIVLTTTDPCQDLESRDPQPDYAMIVTAATLSKAGVAAVLALQRPVSDDACRAFLGEFFRALRPLNTVDDAVAHARRRLAKTQSRDDTANPGDWWKPALFTRSKSNQIWYTPRLSGDPSTVHSAWIDLKHAAKQGELLPVVGPGLTRDVAGSHREIARSWAFSKGFPLGYHERTDLLRVAQFLKYNFSPTQLEQALSDTLSELLVARNPDHLEVPPAKARDLPPSELFCDIARRLREEQESSHGVGSGHENPYTILVRLECPVYVVGALNRALVDTLQSKGRKPHVLTVQQIVQSELDGSVLEDFPEAPSVENPFVYHTFGHLNNLMDATLTQDEYFDFLIDFAQTRKHRLLTILSASYYQKHVVFLGFRHYDWSFLTLLHSLDKLPGRTGGSKRKRVAVQIDPDDDFTIDPNGAVAFLERLLHDKKLTIYWGTSEDFLNDLVKP